MVHHDGERQSVECVENTIRSEHFSGNVIFLRGPCIVCLFTPSSLRVYHVALLVALLVALQACAILIELHEGGF